MRYLGRAVDTVGPHHSSCHAAAARTLTAAAVVVRAQLKHVRLRARLPPWARGCVGHVALAKDDETRLPLMCGQLADARWKGAAKL